MGFTSFTTAELSVDKGIKSTVLVKIRGNLEWARNAFQYNLSEIPNRGFEYQTEGVPALWDCTTYEDGIVQVTSSTSYEGKNSLMLVHDGGTRSGGQALSDYIPISTVESSEVRIIWTQWGDTAVQVSQEVLFYNATFGYLGKAGTTGVNVPGSFFWAIGQATKLAGSRWIKVQLRTSTAAAATAAGTAYFDNIGFVTI